MRLDHNATSEIAELWKERESSQAESFFQTWEWASLLARHYPFFTPAPIAGDNWLIPLVRMHRWGWLTDSLYGMPFMTPGGILTNSNLGSGDWEEIFRRLSRNRAGTTAIVFPPGISVPSHPDFKFETGTTHVVDLQGGSEAVWSRYLSAGRTTTRKAAKLGVTIRRDKGESAIRAHWEILRSHFPLWKPDPPPSYDFIRDVVHASACRLYIAEHEGRVVGSQLVLAYGKEVFSWQAARVLESPTRGTANLLITQALQDACGEGYERFNLGASLGSEGIEGFKEVFGGKKTPYLILKRIHPWLRPFKGR